MKFEPIAQYLNTKLPELIPGQTLFVNQMPANIKQGALLKESYTGTEISGEISALRRGRFQLAVRSPDPTWAKDLAERISTTLTLQNADLGAIYVMSIRPLNEPSAFMLSVGNNHEFLVNFSAIYGIVG